MKSGLIVKFQKWLKKNKESLRKKAVLFRHQMREKFTIMVVPHNQKGVKNLNVPSWMILGVLIFFIGVLTFSTITITKYVIFTVKQKEYMSDNEKMIKELENLIYNSDNLINVQKAFSLSLNRLIKTAGLSDEIFFNETAGLGGPLMDLKEASREVANADTVNLTNEYLFSQIEEIKELSKMEKEMGHINKKINKLSEKLKYFEKVTRYIPSIWPLLGEGEIMESTESKLVISTLPFTPVVATANGKISSVSIDNNKTTIHVSHQYQFISVYSNLYGLEEGVKEGLPVKKGQILGYVAKENGKTLFEYGIFIGNKNGIYPVNPFNFTFLGR